MVEVRAHEGWVLRPNDVASNSRSVELQNDDAFRITPIVRTVMLKMHRGSREP